MKKLILFVLIAFSYLSGKSQTTPVSPQPLSQNSLYYEPSTGRRWGYNGTTRGWYVIPDSTYIKMFGGGGGSDTVSFRSGQFVNAGTVTNALIGLDLTTAKSAPIYYLGFDPSTHDLKYDVAQFAPAATANNGLLDTVISSIHTFQLGSPLTKNSNLTLNEHFLTFNYHQIGSPGNIASTSISNTGINIINSHGVSMNLGDPASNAALNVTSGTSTFSDRAVFNKSIEVNNTGGLGANILWNDDNIHATAQWNAKLVTPGSLQFQSSGFTNNGTITFLGTNNGDIIDQAGVYFAKAAGTNLQYIKGDGSLGTYAAGGSGTVTTISGVAANGFTWSIANPTTTPAITLTQQNATTSQSGLLTSTDWNTFNGKLSANQTITFTPTGDVTGSTTGTTSLTPVLAIGAGKVTNTMLAGSIAASKLVGTDIATIGTLVAGSIPYSLITGTPTALPPSGTAGGELAVTYPNPTLLNSAVIAKVLTGYTSGAGTVASTDNILQAIQKLNGNDALKAPIASPTFTGTVTIPNGGVFGTPTSMTATNVTGLPLTTGVTGTLPVGNGGTGTATAFTAGSVVFAGASGIYTQNNSKLFWDNTNNRLGVGNVAPGVTLDIVSTGQASNFASTAAGNTIIQANASSASYANTMALFYTNRTANSAFNFMRLSANGSASDQFVVRGDGQTSMQSALIMTAPTTSAGTYDILTRNASTGVVEKLAPGQFPQTSQTTTYAILTTDFYVDCNGTFTTTLPTAVGVRGKTYVITNTGVGVITVATTSSQTISGSVTATVATGSSITLHSDNANWFLN